MSGGEGEGAAHSPGLPVIFIFGALLLGAMTQFALKHVKRWTGLSVPYTVALFVLGGMLAAIDDASSGGNSLGLYGASENNVTSLDPHLIFFLFLPVLLFESAFKVNFHVFKRTVGQALVLASLGVLVSTILSALMVRYVMDYDFSWSVALTFGAIISATDPVAVVALLSELGASKRLSTIIESESLLNDGSAMVLFTIFLEFATGGSPSAGDIVGTFFRLSVGGPALGVVFAIGAAEWLSIVYNEKYIETTIPLASAYIVFWLAEGTALKTSGILAVVALGLVFAYKGNSRISSNVLHELHAVWDYLSFAANTLIFVISGSIIANNVLLESTK